MKERGKKKRCGGKECRQKNRQNQTKAGEGSAFLNYVVPQICSDRVHLEPKSPVTRSDRCPCSPPFPHFLLFPCRVSSSTFPNTFWSSMRYGLMAAVKKTGRVPPERLVSFWPQQPPSHLTFPLTSLYQNRAEHSQRRMRTTFTQHT